MTKVAVLDDWQGIARRNADWTPLEARAEVVFFGEAFDSEDETAAGLADFDIILSMRERTRLPASLIHRLPKLRMLGITGKQNASLDLDACRTRGILVSNTTAGAGAGAAAATAELALGLLIAAARGIAAADAAIRRGGFQAGVPVGMGLAGKTLGVIGLGRLGSRMVQYGLALGMTVLGWSQNLTPEGAAATGAEYASKSALLARSDAVSLHLALSPRSRGVIGREDLAGMRPGAILINTARGPLVDEAALVEAVLAGRITAALDVFDREPLPQEHPLRSAPNTVLTPHIGYGVAETWAVFYPQSVDNAVAFLDGRPIRLVPS